MEDYKLRDVRASHTGNVLGKKKSLMVIPLDIYLLSLALALSIHNKQAKLS